MRVPPAVVIAGLLHDTVEDTTVTLEVIRHEFGEEVTRLVDGVTKLTNLPRVTRGDQHAEEILPEDPRTLRTDSHGFQSAATEQLIEASARSQEARLGI